MGYFETVHSYTACNTADTDMYTKHYYDSPEPICTYNYTTPEWPHDNCTDVGMYTQHCYDVLPQGGSAMDKCPQ